MSERSNVSIAEILGENYKITNIECSDYNPSIDGNITVTITVTDVFGDAISNESVTVTASEGNFTQLNGSSITAAATVTATTNSSGQFTLTYNCTEWGLITFVANNTSIQIRVTGFKVVTQTNQTYYKGEDIVHLVMNATGSLTATPSWKDFGTVVGAGSRPSHNVQFMEQFGAVILRVKTDGVLQYRSITGSNVNMTGIIAYANWKI